MKKIFLLLTVVLAAACATETKEGNILNVVPYPNEVQMGEGVFEAKGAAVTYDQAIEAPAVNVITAFAEKLSVVSGVQNAVSAGTADNGFVFVQNDAIPSEAYVLDVKPGCVKVEASGLRGFNYAIQTIKQMLPVEIFGNGPAPKASWTIPAVYVKDEPRFAYRGMHLDECRHFFGIDEVKRYLDVMEIHKLNKFHWHLTEDQGWRIEIKKYPRLTEVGSIRKGTCIKKDFTSHDGVPYGEGLWYTQDQIREVVAYAAAKGIDVIPEIDLPGHMIAALAAYPELGCTGGPYEVWTRWGVSEDLLCAGNEKVYEFLEDILSEVCEMFPGEYIHIGGDECPKVRWEQCPKCQAKIKALGLKDKDGHKAEHFLQSYVMSRMEKFLNAKGRKVIGWDELLEGEAAPNSTIMSWRGEAGGLEATRLGHDAIMTPNTYFYLDYYQSADLENEPFGIGGYLPVEKCYSYEPYPEDMTDEQKKHIIGVQANMWTEYIAEVDHLYYMLLPRMAALSEVQWCAADRKDWDRFYNAAEKFCSIYEIMGYNYATHILQVKGEVTSDVEDKSVTVTLDCSGDAAVRYTTNGKTPTRMSAQYTEPLKITESCVLNASVFRDGVETKVYSKKFDFHKAIGKNVTFSRKPHPKYCSGAPYCLVDALRGPQIFKSQEWIAWNGDSVDITIDMEDSQPYSSVTLGMIADKPSYIFFPTRLAVSVSEDGENYSEVATQEYGVEGKESPDCMKDFTLTFPETAARYVKVTVVPVEYIPDWHYAAGKRTYVFMDEIIVK
ncbi:MAG: beta-N-acetylhexosaminidase [Bacteroidales bacterium]|nr:beta-N-acetylhexosaminidase [Bacteroidales bacterium]